jgi:Holliday junction resolvase RusA-like endonuclease
MPFSIDVPHESGQMACEVLIAPVSSQSPSWRKDAVVNAIRAVVAPVKYLLSSDVSIEITWFISEEERYESDKTADVDNIVKPILDALCGVNGILIDDCQAQCISSHWVDRYAEPEHLQIKISYDPDAFFSKKSIAFVQMEGALCMPFDKSTKQESLRILLEAFEEQFKNRNRILDQGGSYYEAREFMSIQRLFHKSRVSDFVVVQIDDLKQSIGEPV